MDMSHDDFLAMKERNTKKVIVYEKTNTDTNVETGQIMHETTEKVTKAKNREPDFIKIYYETMLAFNQVSGIPVEFILSLSRFIEWSNEGKPMYITINKRVKTVLQEDCKVKLAQVNRYIKIGVDSGLIFRTEYRGVYELNPFFIAKGKWDSIQKLQCKFDYVGGRWVREIEEKTDGNEKENIYEEAEPPEY